VVVHTLLPLASTAHDGPDAETVVVFELVVAEELGKSHLLPTARSLSQLFVPLQLSVKLHMQAPLIMDPSSVAQGVA
jgi:hypothetical protein